MDWIRLHPYASTLALAGLLVIGGVVVVEQRVPAPVPSSTITWSSSAGITTYLPSAQPRSPQSIPEEIIEAQLPQTAVLPSLATTSPITVAAPSTPFSYTMLLAEITASSQKAAQSSGSQTNSPGQLLTQAYAFIPQGLVATSAPAKKVLTPTQQALYEYGNEVGSTIQSFETEHPNQAQTLKDQAEDRSNPVKATALISLGQALTAVGVRMEAMDDVPDSVATLQTALAKSYVDIGTKLQSIPQAQSNTDFANAVESYDTSANAFVSNYATLAQYFSAQGVFFSPQDPGSEFSFNENAGL